MRESEAEGSHSGDDEAKMANGGMQKHGDLFSTLHS